MEPSQQEDSALSQLQSRAQVELLDAVDQLRLNGFQGELDLPQLIVCGDQSSGKSSVLEAISRVSFPMRDTVCTCFASELVLRKAPTESFTVRIQPADSRSPDEMAHLKTFRSPEHLTKPEDFAEVVELATSHIRELHPDGGPAFYEDRLLAEVNGPNMPPLTLVDLPALIHSSTREQGTENINTVRKLISEYMAHPKSIILAVLAADNDLDNQAVLQLALQADPSRHRTPGIITKPDRVDEDSDSEADRIKSARNESIRLELGWHVLKNRGYKDRNATADERDLQEAKFFARSNWSILPANDLGASTLRNKLSHILLDSIRQSVPTLLSDISKRIAECNSNLERLGEARETEIEQRMELTAISNDVRDLIKAGVLGNYNDPFFKHGSAELVRPRLLRSGLRGVLKAFAQHMRLGGLRYRLVPKNTSRTTEQVNLTCADHSPEVDGPVNVTVRTMLHSIDLHINERRGREMRRQPPQDIICDVFHAQCSSWEAIAQLYITRCHHSALAFLEETLHASAPRHIADRIWSQSAEPHLESSWGALQRKLSELIRPYKTGQNITLSDRMDQALNQTAKTCAELNEADFVAEDTEAVEVLVTAWAYYDVAIETFIDNVAILAIEYCLVEGLSTVFEPKSIAAMDAETVNELMQEPPEVVRERQTNQKKLETLQGILSTFNKHVDRFGNIRQGGDSTQQVSNVPELSPAVTLPTRAGTPAKARAYLETPRSILAGQLKQQPTAGYPTPPRTPEARFSVDGTPTKDPGRVHRASNRSKNGDAGQRHRDITPTAPRSRITTSRSPSPLQTLVQPASPREQDVVPSSEEL